VPQFFAPRAPAAGPADRKLSNDIMSYWVNFATTGNPNGPNLAPWPEYRSGGAMLKIQEDGSFAAGPPTDRQIARFNFLDAYLTSASIGQP
jgi:para-nitrobenzyl esterase